MDLIQIRAKLDATTERAVAGKSVSCKAGCSACCQQLVYATLAEAADISEAFPEKVLELKPRLVELSARLMRDAEPMRFWGTRCVFLGDDGLCSVYERRPLVCRGTFVVSPPEHCATGTDKVSKVDTRKEVQVAVGEIMALCEQPKSLLPLPMAMLLASTGLAGSDGG